MSNYIERDGQFLCADENGEPLLMYGQPFCVADSDTLGDIADDMRRQRDELRVALKEARDEQELSPTQSYYRPVHWLRIEELRKLL